jgi:tetratricopeptide (TPR) repeat protein
MKYLVFIISILGCQSNHLNKVTWKSNLISLSSKLERSKSIDTIMANNFIDSTDIFVAAFKDDTICPKFLFTKAQILRALKKPNIAINTLNKITTEYPVFPLNPEAVFLKGFIAETELNDKPQATKYYKECVEMYPNHSLGQQAKFLIDLMNNEK